MAANRAFQFAGELLRMSLSRSMRIPHLKSGIDANSVLQAGRQRIQIRKMVCSFILQSLEEKSNCAKRRLRANTKIWNTDAPEPEKKEFFSSWALFILIMLLIGALFTSYILQQRKIQAVHETVLSIFGGE